MSLLADVWVALMSRLSSEIKVANLDLNLIVSLDALLQERSVSKAALRLGLSQPSLSASLARLRRHFDDELLARVGNQYELTPLAAQLVDVTQNAMASVTRVFTSAARFEPATAAREFTVLMSDYATTVLGPALARQLSEQAPGVRLRVQQLAPHLIDNADETLRSVDAIVLPPGILSDLPHCRIFDDEWVCVVAMDAPVAADGLTVDQLGELPMVMTYQTSTAFTPVAKQLEMLGVEFNVQIVTESFLSLPFLVAAVHGVGLIQKRLADRLMSAAAVRVLPCPFEPVPLIEALWWHPMYTSDSGHRWLRERFVEAGA
ncbi:LysR family transcriptional regulator, partial [Actinoplanes sp. NPDC051633]|uniref:LysR family transcriptional regulator n=1 Tax=Actinoplanes sp. NPDC051633 TaxID=3155670 RepID=UPI0034236952